MAVSFNRELGVWQVDGRGAYDSQEAASIAESGAGPEITNVSDLTDFQRNQGQAAVRSPLTTADLQANKELTHALSAANPDNVARANSAQTAESNWMNATGDTSAYPRGARGSSQMSEEYLAAARRDPNHPAHAYASQLIRVENDPRVGGITASGVGISEIKADPNAAGAGTQTTREDTVDERTARAGNDAAAVDEANQAEARKRNQDVYDKINSLGGGEYELSDEARGYQKEGLQQQRELLERMLGFDPNQYATQFADQTLARQVALGRSGGTSAAAQQAGMFAAMDQAPALYAEGARAAVGIENTRLGMAESAAKAFGELGTMTRNSDEGRAQFEAQLPLEITKTLASFTNGALQLDEARAARFSDVYVNFAEIQSRYAGMDSAEQIKLLDNMMRDKQLDQEWDMFKKTLAEQGKVGADDLLGGFLQLGGSLIGAGGVIGAAYAGKK